jgi:predicted TPR repeat methyltransferase
MNIGNALFEEANAHQSNGDFAKAIHCYKQLITDVPKYPKAMHFLGLTYAQIGDMKHALLYLENAILLEHQDASLYNHLGSVYKTLNMSDKAIEAFKKAISYAPKYAHAHSNLAGLYTAQDNYSEALRHYKHAVHSAPDFTAAHYNLGLLLLKMQHKEAALTQFNNVLVLYPEHSDANFYVGVLLLEDNQLDKAEAAFQQVLKLNPEHTEALCNMGSVALKRKDGQLAINYFTKALALDNDHEYARNNLAATFMHYDRFENALTHYKVLLNNHPENTEYHYNTAVAEMALGHLDKAIMHFKKVLYHNEHAASLANMAAIYIKLDKRSKAAEFLERALLANPKDASSQHLLNGDNPQPETNPEYAKHLFNNYALNYENHMQEQLQYSLPQHIARIIKTLELDKKINCLDLGCGTGLLGPILREVSQTLTGVDIAPKMLEKAAIKNCYDKLLPAELMDFFQEEHQHYNLIVCADVLPYFGELNPLFKAIHHHLATSAYFIFSTEISEEPNWNLQASARFCHHPDYIKTVCKEQNFTIVHQEKVCARMQNHQALAVYLWMVVAEKY